MYSINDVGMVAESGQQILSEYEQEVAEDVRMFGQGLLTVHELHNRMVAARENAIEGLGLKMVSARWYPEKGWMYVQNVPVKPAHVRREGERAMQVLDAVR